MQTRVTAMLAALPLAATAAEQPSLPAATPVDGVAGIVLNLLLVLLLIVVCGWLYARGPARMRGAAGTLDIVASRQVGSRERLAVVQVGDEQLLLGITPNGISHLHTLTEPLAPAAAGTPSTFGERLREFGAALRRGEERPS